MRDSEKEEFIFAKVRFDAANDEATVGIADFFSNNADGIGALNAKRACQEVRAIIQHAGSLENSLAGVFRNGTCSGGIVQDGGYGTGRQANIFSNGFEGYGARGLHPGCSCGFHRNLPRQFRNENA